MNVLVIGAGATGLAAAYLLQRAGHGVTILEGADQPGGLLATFPVGDGGRLEHFYHHFFTHDAEINWWLAELDLVDRVVFRPTSMGVFRGGRLYPFDGPRDLLRFRAIGWGARLRFGISSALLAYRARYTTAEETAALGWFRRWAGRSATEAIWAPMLAVKFGDAADRIPLAWMAGRLRQRVRSRRRGAEQLGYLTGSLQVLVDRCVQRLRELGTDLRTGTPVRRLLTTAGRVTGAETGAGEITADAVIATVPTPLLASLVRPLDVGYADRLGRIQYYGALCTVLALRESLSPVYWLNVADPGYDFGGVIEQTRLVPAAEYGGLHLVYLSRYLPADHPLWVMDDAVLLDRQLDQLERLFGRDVRPLLVRHWVFRGRYAAPLTEIGYHRDIPSYRSPLPGLYVAGMPQIYPDERSVNNSIRVAAEVIRAMGLPDVAESVPRGLSLAGRYGRST